MVEFLETRFQIKFRDKTFFKITLKCSALQKTLTEFFSLYRSRITSIVVVYGEQIVKNKVILEDKTSHVFILDLTLISYPIR